MISLESVIIYTDGACIGNPGPGGYGVILRFGNHKRELSGGYRLTTNNRMEIMAAILGLQALKRKCKVTLYSDSRYLVDAIRQGWAIRWKTNGWWRNRKERASNSDLWAILLGLCEAHEVTFEWTKGHAGTPDNERCDVLATQAAKRLDLPADIEYENSENPKSTMLI